MPHVCKLFAEGRKLQRVYIVRIQCDSTVVFCPAKILLVVVVVQDDLAQNGHIDEGREGLGGSLV
jgi:hypothetical protein